VAAVIMIAVGLATAALAGQASSGDRGVVLTFPHGAMVAVIDGLGHGSEACEAADAAVKALATDPASPVDELVRRCHASMRRTRGAVMTVASFAPGSMTWVGVGNVEGLLVRNTSIEAVAMRGGIVGYQLPHLVPRRLPVSHGDTLVLATDGIRHGFRAEVNTGRDPQVIADAILANWSKTTDDACVAIARYVGGAP
jgi:phosphoserine phosphatase RsbX